ncbi:EAL domain-containing protein [Acinetobacter sp. V110_1]|uniref:putative bifunctional diguanylate cyclase/phosphodiesterase n=1 Tax=unclassified Acinetobacter TaxID=196816 RepID=UPI00287CEFB2|nr:MULTISPECIES: EAL domain-containing protein [unclassified Acinetobacter]MDS7945353.1 EAL domain-containing protein [Acinetobacter sp. V110_1]MDS7968793.1 EAL domain-containing protein [Acinetobacter sp. V117_2]
MKKYFTVDLFMIASSYFKKRKKNYRNVKDQQLTIAAKANIFICIIFCLFWTIYFAFAHMWLIVCMDIGFTLVSMFSLFLIYKNRISAGILLSQAVLLIFPVVFCLFFDIATPHRPQVAHLFLPAGAILGYLNYRRDPSFLQIILILLSIGCFIFFSGTSFTLNSAVPLSEDIRNHGGWIATCVATLMICISIYTMQLEIQIENSMVHDLRLALSKEQFELFYQPQINSSEQLIGAEALLRWHHPTLGYIPTQDFIPAAESFGLMPEIGEWVLVQACKVLQDWSKKEETKDLTLSVNISADHFMQPLFEQTIIAMVERYGITPSRLILEITENIALNNCASMIEKMNFLSRHGIQLSLDDFGTGYSSLSYLQKMPISQIKIDRSFVEAALDDKRSNKLVTGIIKIGLDLNLRVLVEGIETAEQFSAFKSNGCTEFQGFLWGCPMPLNDFIKQLPHFNK